MPDVDTILDDFFGQALQGLMDLARTTDKPHIKLRALLEIARLCNPAKRKKPFDGGEAGRRSDSPRRGGSPTPYGTPSASAGPQAPANSHATTPPDAPIPVARAPGSLSAEPPTPRAAAPCRTCQTTTPCPACNTCLPRMDPIERTERIRMATQARAAIALNESRNLPIPKHWRAWATVDEGIHPSDPSVNSVPSVFTPKPEASDSS